MGFMGALGGALKGAAKGAAGALKGGGVLGGAISGAMGGGSKGMSQPSIMSDDPARGGIMGTLGKHVSPTSSEVGSMNRKSLTDRAVGPRRKYSAGRSMSGRR